VPAPGGRQPLLWAATAFSAGILFAHYFWRPPIWWIVIFVAFTAFSIFYLRRRPWAAWLLALMLLFISGCLRIQLRAAGDTNANQILHFINGNEVIVTAHVVGATDLRPNLKDRQLVDLETEAINTGATVHEIHAGLRLSIYSNESNADVPVARLFRYGERLRFSAKLFAPHTFRNPGAFDYAGYLAEKGIVVQASTKGAKVEVLPGFVGSGLELWRTNIHRSIIEKIHTLWPEFDAVLIDAMVVGEDAFIDRSTRTDFQRSGTFHVLVVSGMNIGILAFVVFWVLRRFHISDLYASAAVVLLSIAYAFLTDVGAPIWRATLMLTIYLGARLFYRDRSILNAIGAAGIGLLICDPRALLGPSFQLTFLSVVLIAAIGVPILERTSQPYARGLHHLTSTTYDRILPPRVAQFRLDIRMIAGRLMRFTRHRFPLFALAGTARLFLTGSELLVISGLMQLGLALPMACYFHRATLVGLPANLLVVPLTGILMPAAISAITLAYISTALASIPARVAAYALHGITGTVQWLGTWRISDTRVATPELYSVLFAIAALVFAAVVARRQFWTAACGLIALAISAFWLTTISPRAQIHPGKLEITSIDVGQGDSTLLVLPDGRTILVDAGGLPHWMHSDFDIGENVVSPYLWTRRMSRIDIAIATHAHADHIGGMGAILSNFRPKELWIGADLPSRDLDRLLAQAKALDIPVVRHQAGEEVTFGETRLRILAPALDPQTRVWNPNDDCLVMKVTYRETSALLEGDAEPQIERKLLDENPDADLLRVAHHGSARATSPPLLAAVHPRFAIISVGARNVYGHPRFEVLSRLAAANVRTFRTDLNGAVTFYLDGASVTPAVSPP
jgi:competence protein ComEC